MTTPQVHVDVAEHPPPSINTDQMDELLLVAVPSAISCARMLVGSVAHNWELTSSVTAMLSDVVDEMVAHAVATTGRAATELDHHEGSRVLPLLAVRIRQEPTSQVIEVWDEGSSAPQGLDEAAPILRNLQWGYQRPTPNQRVIWCVLAGGVNEAEQTVQFRPLLPHRGRRLLPVDQADVMRDPVVLQRILDRLRGLDTTSRRTDADRL